MTFTRVTSLWICLLVGLLWTGGCMEVPLPSESSSLSATFILDGEEDSEGVEVLLPGTAYRGYTDSNGFIQFDNLPPRVYELIARTDGFLEHRESNIQLESGDRIHLGEIHLSPLPLEGQIEGRILVEDIPDATVEVRLLDADMVINSATDGKYTFTEIKPGTYDLSFFKSGYQAEPLKVTVEPGSVVILGPITMKKSEPAALQTGAIMGQVLLKDLTSKDEYRPDASGVLVLITGSSAFATTRENGSYWIDAIQSGTHTLFFQKDGYLTSKIVDYDVKAGVLNEVPPVTLTAIHQPVIDPSRESQDPQADGSQVKEITGPGILKGSVFLQGSTEHGKIKVRVLETGAETSTETDGSYLLADLPPGTFTIRAEAEGYQAIELGEIEIREGQVTRAPRIELMPLKPIASVMVTRLYGQIVLEDMGPQPGTLVAIEGTSISAVTGREGTFILDQVPFGSYLILVTRDGYEPRSIPVDVQEPVDIPIPVLRLKPIEKFLTMIESKPANGAKKVEVSDRVTVLLRFSERIKLEDLKKAINVQPQVATEFENPDVDTVIVHLLRIRDPQVVFNTDYTLSIDAQFRSAEGHRFEVPYKLTFKTGGPRILGSIPGKGSSRVILAPDEPIYVDFNQSVNLRDLRDKLRISPSAGEVPNLVPQRMPFGQRVGIQIQVQPKRSYRISIPKTVRTVDNQTYENAPYTIQFRSGDYEDLRDRTDEYLDEIDDFLDR